MINIVVNGKEILLNTPDEMGDYGSTFHNSPLKVITVTAEAAYEDNANGGYFSVIAVPETVKAFDIDNQPVIWSMEAEKDECNDTNGRAEFKGILKGFLHTEDQKDIYLDTQLMDCELKYNSGMSC